jgi:hypothetical protein
VYGTEDAGGYKFAHLARVLTGNLAGTLQEGGFKSFELFSALYWLEGTDALNNQFEINANLWWGHYLGPFGNTRNCGYFT